MGWIPLFSRVWAHVGPPGSRCLTLDPAGSHPDPTFAIVFQWPSESQKKGSQRTHDVHLFKKRTSSTPPTSKGRKAPWRQSFAVLCVAVLCVAVLCFAFLCFALLCVAVRCCALLCFALLCLAFLCCALLCFVVLCVAVLCFAFLCGALLCFAVLCVGVLCVSLLCFAVLCVAVLCFAFLCCALLCVAPPQRSEMGPWLHQFSKVGPSN